MERKKASDFPPEVLKLFDGYIHGAMTRRDFLDRAAKFAVSGFTAAAMLESLTPNYAWAQQVARNDPRILTEYLAYLRGSLGANAARDTNRPSRDAHKATESQSRASGQHSKAAFANHGAKDLERVQVDSSHFEKNTSYKFICAEGH